MVEAIAAKVGGINPEALYDELLAGGIGRATVYRALDLRRQPQGNWARTTSWSMGALMGDTGRTLATFARRVNRR